MPAEVTRTRTRQPRDQRADAIVAAALGLFAARGFRGTSITSVAAEVGLTDAGVLHHFPTTRALLAAVLERSTVESLGEVREMFAVGGIETLRRLAAWGEVMERQLHQTGLEITLAAESLDPDADLHGYFETRYRTLQRWLRRAIKQGIDRGELRPDTDPHQEATDLIAFLDGIRLQWYFGAVKSLADAVDRHITALIDRLAAP
jgi:AcrR family transcriptional regulator